MRVSYGKGFDLAPLATERPTMRAQVERLQSVLEQQSQVECPVKNHFAPGVYAREMLVPAGTVATGAVHKTEHLTIVVGHCYLTTEDGTRELIGHHTIVSKPGIKRAIYAVQDTILTTIHATDETDEAKLVELLTESTKAELLGGAQNMQLLRAKAEGLK
jgi:hypothetical protein